MDLDRDEMQRLIRFKMGEWVKASSVLGAQGQANMASKTKKIADKQKDPNAQKNAFVADTTVPGEKKDTTQEMPTAYHPKYVEAAWYSWWEKKGFFHADAQKIVKNPDAKKYVMVIPPPNVTGALHLGHALMLSIEDAVMRYKRMNGYETLWLPGVDHAGIATQSVVEKQLWKKEKKTRHDLGREEFVKQVWNWKDEYGGRINNQFRRFGISVDWERFAFTLDETRSKAVIEAFVRMYEKGLIYRDTRLVNWSATLKTAISDLEIEYIDINGPTFLKCPGHDPEGKYEFGALTEFAYKVKGTDKEIVVATTRLETMLGDVAVAVHPEDPRYTEFVGKELEHPFIKDRKVTVITDDVLVKMDFGTGAVKITPAHDPNDYKCGKKHSLPFINVLNDDGTINHNGGEFTGMMRYDCRNAMTKRMQELGILRGKKPNPMRLGLCSKSNDILEPIVKPQWYVDCKDMAKRSTDAVRQGDLKILPDTHEKTWFSWLDNIQDWCISRQLWWGHRIPVYLVTIPGLIDHPDPQNNDHYIVGRNIDEARANAAKKFNVEPEKIQLEQDSDVLDTWFSSGVFPMSTMGWPDKEADDLKAFFPGDLLETGHDILFFWVARMVMMSLELTDKLPFHTVYLHPMVRDEEGQKMSKSKGNVIDPLEVMDSCNLETLLKKLYESNLPESEIKRAVQGKKKDFPDGIPECGTDALRFTLMSYMMQNSINLDVKRVIGYRTFCNKIWNVSRFAIIMNFPKDFVPEKDGVASVKLGIFDKWILTCLDKAITQVRQNFDDFKFGEMVSRQHEFWLYELADVYIESIKPVLQGTDEEAKKAALNTLYVALDSALKMLHPVMPYLSEELFQRLPHRKGEVAESVCIAEFPEAGKHDFSSENVEDKVQLCQSALKSFRSQFAALNLAKNASPIVYIKCKSQQQAAVIEEGKHAIISLIKAKELNVLLADAQDPEGCLKQFVSDDITIMTKVVGLIDIKLEVDRVNKQQAKIQDWMDKLQKKMSIPQYEEKVKESVRQENADKMSGFQKEFAENEKAIAELSQHL